MSCFSIEMRASPEHEWIRSDSTNHYTTEKSALKDASQFCQTYGYHTRVVDQDGREIARFTDS